VSYDELEKAIIWYSSKPVSRLKHIYIHGLYPAVSIFDKKIHIHRLLMSYWLKIKLPTNYSVHHLDETKLNASKDNIVLILSSVHGSKHNKGKTLSENHKRLISLANRKKKGIRQKKHRPDIDIQNVVLLKESGMSINAIALKLGCDWTTIRARLRDHDNPELLKGGTSNV
jgi:hypothetical protein